MLHCNPSMIASGVSAMLGTDKTNGCVSVAFWLLMRCLVGPLRTAIKLLSYLFVGDKTPSICKVCLKCSALVKLCKAMCVPLFSYEEKSCHEKQKVHIFKTSRV